MNKLEELIKTFNNINTPNIQGFDKFNQLIINYHSTKLEGLSLSEIESEILLHHKLTPKGRDLYDLYMLTDHSNALSFVLEQANQKNNITVELIQKINAKVLKNTGEIFTNAFGSFDMSEGVLRKWEVTNGRGHNYPNFDKVEGRIRKLVQTVNEKMKVNLSIREITDLAFDMHYNLVALHPFGDGNGRTSRLLMNYILAYYNLPLTIVNIQDKKEYIDALQKTDKIGEKKFFIHFMYNQYEKYLFQIIDKHITNTKVERTEFLF
ncbi:Fic family protein [Myroides odoratimimus]|uniref:Fic family protein n=1 Tax=Myroides odoratimimus TaxID=76832 RepID=UPI0025753FFD|nr:Fic family protein [Myroides odoratimimus]MDM1397769.1 Fic family protein [Myroides odoratimimus]